MLQRLRYVTAEGAKGSCNFLSKSYTNINIISVCIGSRKLYKLLSALDVKDKQQSMKALCQGDTLGTMNPTETDHWCLKRRATDNLKNNRHSYENYKCTLTLTNQSTFNHVSQQAKYVLYDHKQIDGTVVKQ